MPLPRVRRVSGLVQWKWRKRPERRELPVPKRRPKSVPTRVSRIRQAPVTPEIASEEEDEPLEEVLELVTPSRKRQRVESEDRPPVAVRRRPVPVPRTSIRPSNSQHVSDPEAENHPGETNQLVQVLMAQISTLKRQPTARARTH